MRGKNVPNVFPSNLMCSSVKRERKRKKQTHPTPSSSQPPSQGTIPWKKGEKRENPNLTFRTPLK